VQHLENQHTENFHLSACDGKLLVACLMLHRLQYEFYSSANNVTSNYVKKSLKFSMREESYLI
jgi:hypothetical protein